MKKKTKTSTIMGYMLIEYYDINNHLNKCTTKIKILIQYFFFSPSVTNNQIWKKKISFIG